MNIVNKKHYPTITFPITCQRYVPSFFNELGFERYPCTQDIKVRFINGLIYFGDVKVLFNGTA